MEFLGAHVLHIWNMPAVEMRVEQGWVTQLSPACICLQGTPNCSAQEKASSASLYKLIQKQKPWKNTGKNPVTLANKTHFKLSL